MRFGHGTATGIARADKKDDQARHLLEGSGVDRSFALESPVLFANPHPGRIASQMRGTRVDHHVEIGDVSQRQGRGRGRLIRPAEGSQHQGRRSELHHAAHERIGRAAQGQNALGCDQAPHFRGETAEQTIRLREREHQGQGPWPQPPGQAPADQRQGRNPVADLLGAAQQESQGHRARGFPKRSKPGYAIGPQRTGGKAIDRFCRQPDHAPLSQAGDRLVDHVARIIALQKVDPLRGARSIRHRNPNIAAVEGWRRFATKNSACEQRRFLRGTWVHHNHRLTSCKPGHAASTARAGAALCLS